MAYSSPTFGSLTKNFYLRPASTICLPTILLAVSVAILLSFNETARRIIGRKYLCSGSTHDPTNKSTITSTIEEQLIFLAFRDFINFLYIKNLLKKSWMKKTFITKNRTFCPHLFHLLSINTP